MIFFRKVRGNAVIIQNVPGKLQKGRYNLMIEIETGAYRLKTAVMLFAGVFGILISSCRFCKVDVREIICYNNFVI